MTRYRHHLLRSRGYWAAVLLFVFTLILTVTTFPNFGLHWDCSLFLDDGLRVADWIGARTGSGADVPSMSEVDYYWGRANHQPPMYRVLSGLAIASFRDGMGEVYAARLVSATAFSLTVALVFLLLYRRHGWRPAVVGAVVLLTFPRLFAFAHFNVIEALMMFLYTAVIVAVPWTFKRRTGPLWGTLFYLLAFLTKVQGFFIVIVHGIWILLEMGLRKLGKSEGDGLGWKTLLLWVGLPSVGAILLMPVFWPYLPFDHWRGLREYMHAIFEHGQLNVLYFGKVFDRPETPPWHYVLVMPLITIPLTSLLLVGTGIVSVVRRTFCGEEGMSRERLWLLGGAVHLGIMAMPGVPRYDGTRLLFMAYPFFALLAGLGYRALESWFAARQWSPARIRGYLVTVFGLVLVVPVIENAAAFPYQMIYYNALVGGPSGAIEMGFDGDYLGVYAHEAYPDINRIVPPGGTLFIAAADTGNHFGYAAVSMRGRGANQALRPDIRILPASAESSLLRCAVPRYFLLGGRMAAYDDLTRSLVEKSQEVEVLERDGIQLLGLYRLPEVADLPDLTGAPVDRYGGVLLNRMTSSDGGRTWDAFWSCRAPVREHLALLLTSKGSENDAEKWYPIPQAVYFLPTQFWRPGDVFRTTYSPDVVIEPDQALVDVVPMGIEKEQVQFVPVLRSAE